VSHWFTQISSSLFVFPRIHSYRKNQRFPISNLIPSFNGLTAQTDDPRGFFAWIYVWDSRYWSVFLSCIFHLRYSMFPLKKKWKWLNSYFSVLVVWYLLPQRPLNQGGRNYSLADIFNGTKHVHCFMTAGKGLSCLIHSNCCCKFGTSLVTLVRREQQIFGGTERIS
jgi:hypothetical protein